MLSINTSAALNYDGKTRLNAIVTFDYDADTKILSIADATVYPAGDERKQLNVEVYDHFGGKVDGHLGADGDASPSSSDGLVNAFEIDLSDLNLTEGVAVIATVASLQGRTSTGSVHDVATLKTTGNV